MATSNPTGQQTLRADAVTTSWHRHLRGWNFRTALGEFKYRAGVSALVADADVCVTELDVGNLNAWALAFRPHKSALVLWGHGKPYVSNRGPTTESLMMRLASRADHVLTYTEGGRTYLTDRGLAATQVTAVGNSTDTATLRREIRQRRERSLSVSETFPDQEITGRLVACYVGGLDQEKRIDFLLDAARRAYEIDTRFLLLMAGSGADAALVSKATAGMHVAWTSHVDARGLADITTVSKSLWMPGRVGLVALDALTAGTPVLTTAYKHHAPEIEYLTEGTSMHTLPDDPSQFAEEALKIMRNPWIGNTSGEVAANPPDVTLVAERIVKALASVCP